MLEPTRVRVPHDTHIRAARAAIWRALRAATPANDWKAVSRVLATLEAVLGYVQSSCLDCVWLLAV